MSKEMWQFAEDGQLYMEKALKEFLPDLFSRWRDSGTNHTISIVMFARVALPESASGVFSGAVQRKDGSWCIDYYKVVEEWETRADWNKCSAQLKLEFMNFQCDVLSRKTGAGAQVPYGEITSAQNGNLLEAVNIALNPFDRHYIDRDLSRTGLCIIVVSPGTGLFRVDKSLLRLTTERMLENGIRLDLVCLSRLPLHTRRSLNSSRRSQPHACGSMPLMMILCNTRITVSVTILAVLIISCSRVSFAKDRIAVKEL